MRQATGGHAQDPVAGELKSGITRAIALERRAGAVRREASRTLTVDLRMPDGVDAAMDQMQRPGCEPASNGTAIEAKRDELPPSYHAVLPGGQFGYPTITWMIFCTT